MHMIYTRYLIYLVIPDIAFILIKNHKGFRSAQNRKENCHHDHIPFNLKGKSIFFVSVYIIQA